MVPVDGFCLERLQTDGVWADPPWFAAPQYDALGFSREAREKAVRGLLRAYPPEVCLRIARDNTLQSLGPVVVLFGTHYPPLVTEFLQLGIDLEDAAVTDSELLGRLTHRKSFTAAMFEVRVEASLRRAGHPTQRMEARPERRTPDFTTSIAGEEHEVEIKFAHNSDYDRAAKEMEEALLGSCLHIPGYELRWNGLPSLMERLMEAVDASNEVPEVRRIAAEIRDTLTPWKNKLVLPPEISVPGLGSLVPTPKAGLGHFVISNLGELPELQKARRVARMIRNDGVTKFDGRRPGIIVVGVYHEAKHPLIEQAVREDAAANPESYRRCRLFVLADRTDLPRVKRQSAISYAFLGPGRTICTPAETVWARHVAQLPGEPALLVGPLSPDGALLDVNTTRKEKRNFLAAQASFDAPGHGVSIQVDLESGRTTVLKHDVSPTAGSTKDVGTGGQ